MLAPGENTDPIEKHNMQEIVLFESRVADLMFAVASSKFPNVKSCQVMTDDNFVHRRDRKTNDIHVFLELANGQYFHLRAYTRHMLDMDTLPTDQIFLTGYTKPSPTLNGGSHSFHQTWYPWQAGTIANAIIAQNPALFA